MKGIATDCWRNVARDDNQNSYKLIRVCIKVVVASCVVGEVWGVVQIGRVGM